MTQLMVGGTADLEVISGCAEGVDQAGLEWAEEYGHATTRFDPLNPNSTETNFSAEKYGKAAFPLRNSEMAEYAAPDGLLVAVWDGQSDGTRDMIECALEEGLDIHVKTVYPVEMDLNSL